MPPRSRSGSGLAIGGLGTLGGLGGLSSTPIPLQAHSCTGTIGGYGHRPQLQLASKPVPRARPQLWHVMVVQDAGPHICSCNGKGSSGGAGGGGCSSSQRYRIHSWSFNLGSHGAREPACGGGGPDVAPCRSVASRAPSATIESRAIAPGTVQSETTGVTKCLATHASRPRSRAHRKLAIRATTSAGRASDPSTTAPSPSGSGGTPSARAAGSIWRRERREPARGESQREACHTGPKTVRYAGSNAQRLTAGAVRSLSPSSHGGS
jgi:hypothetical protein